MKLNFINTCKCCPEQYDVYDEDNNQVAYVRLRHGYLSVRCPDADSPEIYGTYGVKGSGEFYDAKERAYFIAEIAKKIKDHLSISNDYEHPGNYEIII